MALNQTRNTYVHVDVGNFIFCCVFTLQWIVMAVFASVITDSKIKLITRCNDVIYVKYKEKKHSVFIGCYAKTINVVLCAYLKDYSKPQRNLFLVLKIVKKP